ncbi:MAG: hypothetical protein Q8N69_00575, partial [bacterium]|nr:hypothetical protein [bacterium]
EEPPAHAVFILATTEIQKMIPTIISRCQRHDFKKLTMDEIMKRLAYVAKKEGVKIEKQALELIALGSGGAVRDAEGLLDQVLTFGSNRVEIKAEDIRDLLGLVDMALISQFVDRLAKKDGKETLNFLESALEEGCDPIEFAKTLVSYLRLAMLLKVDPEFKNPFISSLMKEQQDKIKEQLNLLNIADLQKALNLFMDAESKMKYSSIPQLPLELAIVDFTAQNP